MLCPVWWLALVFTFLARAWCWCSWWAWPSWWVWPSWCCCGLLSWLTVPALPADPLWKLTDIPLSDDEKLSRV